VKPDLCNRYIHISLTSKPWALSAMASTADHGPPAPVPGKLTCSPHHGRLRVGQQRGGDKQHGDGVCSTVLAAAARWQRWQSSGGSAAAARRRRAVRSNRRWQHGGGVGCTVAALAAGWQRWQKQNSSSSAEASTTETGMRRFHRTVPSHEKRQRIRLVLSKIDFCFRLEIYLSK
jgi:hypothetical protein